jgi:leucine dehydrogenase
MERLDIDEYDEVYRLECGANVAFISLHAVLSGRSFGGTRFASYPTEREALDDALALSRAMSRKVVMSGVEGGGGKTVIMDRGGDRRETIRQVGAFIESLGGRYHTGGDLGFGSEDMAVLRTATQYVASGDLEGPTADTVVACMKVAGQVERVAIQGMGGIGLAVARALLEEGVDVIACDVREVSSMHGVEVVDVDEIYGVPCDVFVPCAVGGVLNEDTIPRLRCRLVCGGANNPFMAVDDPERLRVRGIDVVPDIVANCGATIVGASQVLGEAEFIAERMAAVPGLARTMIECARKVKRSPHELAIEMADAKIAAARSS